MVLDENTSDDVDDANFPNISVATLNSPVSVTKGLPNNPSCSDNDTGAGSSIQPRSTVFTLGPQSYGHDLTSDEACSDILDEDGRGTGRFNLFSQPVT